MKQTMKCKKVKLLLAPYILGDLADDLKLFDQLEAHLWTCNCCTGEYQSVKQTIEFVEECKDIFAEVFAEIDLERARKENIQKQNWVRISAESMEKPKSLRRFLRIGTTAACLAFVVFTWLVFSNYSKPQNIPQASSSKQIASALRSSVEVELVRPSGNIVVATGEKLVADNELKTLLINGRHRMVMNSDTVLTVEPLVENSNIGCLVKLDFGQIYTHVEHDGNPFIIDTAHGKAVITGTAFDVKVTHTSTTLVVSEGTVRFESESGVVKVAAGQKSEMVGHLAPTIPVSCNTTQLIAWATGYEPEKPLDEVRPATETYDITDLPPLVMPVPIDLESVDYEQWVKQKREWFKQQFPWIFQLKDALAKEGIEVDYPELLIKTGDVWQFVCIEVSPIGFSVINPDSLLKTGFGYGFDKHWLLENVPAAKYALEKPLSENYFTGLKAFEQWLKYLNENEGLKPPTTIYSYHASAYLAETRSLIWFSVRDGQYDLTNQERAKVLFLLQEEVTAACNCQNDVLYPTVEQNVSCEEICQESFDNIVGYIKTMKGVEEKIMEYEIGE